MTPRFLTILTGRNAPKIQSQNIQITKKRLRDSIEDAGRNRPREEDHHFGFCPFERSSVGSTDGQKMRFGYCLWAGRAVVRLRHRR
jgi:hypothetical protein